MTDQFFTPPSVAKKLVSFFRTTEIETIADFAAGDGELLKAASHRWPEATCYATDLDSNCVSRLKRFFPEWRVGKCNFFNERSRSLSSVLGEVEQGISLILLNPPFSCRGSTYIEVQTSSLNIRCSTAMAFILLSLPYLSSNGKLVSILPASSIKSHKDSDAWSYIKSHFDVRNVASFNKGTFQKCSASTIVVRLKKRSATTKNIEVHCRSIRLANLGIDVNVIRGCVPMHSARNGLAGTKYDLVHTSDMNYSNITKVRHGIRVSKRSTSGPCVLIPRVGQPTQSKCVLYLGRKDITLSDCVYAIRCDSSNNARLLQRTMINNWSHVASRYGGTCAPYITVDNLIQMLLNFGVNVLSDDSNKH